MVKKTASSTVEKETKEEVLEKNADSWNTKSICWRIKFIYYSTNKKLRNKCYGWNKFKIVKENIWGI